MIHLYHGDGKGKTTAAFGLALRALGAGWEVLVVQFLKDGTSGEARQLALLPGVTLLHDVPPVTFTFRMTEGQRAASRRTHDANLAQALDALRGPGARLVVLDEALDALNANLLDADLLRQVLDVAAGAQAGPELVLTGRNPASWLLDAADYVTEMRSVRHPYERGVAARLGVEY